MNEPKLPNVNQQQLSMVKALLQRSGMNAEQMVRMICQQRGIDVDKFMEQFKSK